MEIGKSDRCIDLVGLVTQLLEHRDCFRFVMGLTEHVTVEPDDGIGGDEQLVRLQLLLVRARLRTRYIIRNITGFQIRRIGLIGIDINGRKWQV